MVRWLVNVIALNIKYLRRTNILGKMMLNKTHKASDLGWFWALAKPIMYMVMFYFAISLGFKSSKDIDGIVTPYFIWMSTGIIAWFYINDLLTGGASCFNRFKSLLTKSNYPSQAIPMIPVISFLYVHVIMIGILLMIAIVFGVKPDIHWIQIPLYTFLAIVFTYLWSYLTGLLNVLSADIFSFIKVTKPAFFWLSGVLFNSRDRVNRIFLWNPITFLVEGYRNSVCYNMWIWEEPVRVQHFAIVMLIMLVFTFFLSKKIEHRLGEIL